jgi:hypothetical protein
MVDERALVPINDMLNPKPPMFGMPWYVVLGVFTFSALLFLLPGIRVKIFALLLFPSVMGIGYWLVKGEPKAIMLIIHERLLPPEFDPGK